MYARLIDSINRIHSFDDNNVTSLKMTHTKYVNRDFWMDIADGIKHRCKLCDFPSNRHMTREDTGKMQIRMGSDIAIRDLKCYTHK